MLSNNLIFEDYSNKGMLKMYYLKVGFIALLFYEVVLLITFSLNLKRQIYKKQSSLNAHQCPLNVLTTTICVNIYELS